MRLRPCLFLLMGSVLLIPLAGCSNTAPPMTSQEKNEFKGGPMPESARQIMQQKMQEANQKNKPETAPNAGPSGSSQ